MKAIIGSFTAFGLNHEIGGGGKSHGMVVTIRGNGRVATIRRSQDWRSRTITIKGKGTVPVSLKLVGVSEKGAIRRARKFVKDGNVPSGLRDTFQRLEHNVAQRLERKLKAEREEIHASDRQFELVAARVESEDWLNLSDSSLEPHDFAKKVLENDLASAAG